jgi:hypothetical protein
VELSTLPSPQKLTLQHDRDACPERNRHSQTGRWDPIPGTLGLCSSTPHPAGHGVQQSEPEDKAARSVKTVTFFHVAIHLEIPLRSLKALTRS